MPKKGKKAEKPPTPPPEEESEEEESASGDDSSSSSSEEEVKKKTKKDKKKGADTEEAAASDGPKEKPDDEEKPAAAAAPAGPLKVEFRPHTEYPDITGAEVVEYCSVCGLPPDFCQYGPTWDKCRPVCMEKFPHYYPELSGISLEEAQAKAKEASEKGKVKELPGGKTKRSKSPEVTIKKLTRGGRKCVTSITGLDGFGVKLDAAAKLFKKKFACGSSVVKGENGAADSVDIQGDFEEEVIDLICDEYKDVTRKKVTLVEGGTKKKGKSGK